MLKTLYITDLDGTLLNKNAEVSSETASLLNSAIEAGAEFSFATARTAVTAVPITKDIKINVPVVLMNGVCIYDISKKEYVNIESIPRDAFDYLVSVLRNFHLSGFLFSVTDGELETCYENLDSENARRFYNERTERYGKMFVKVNDFSERADKNNVYFSVTDTKEKLDPVYALLKKNDDININFYCDVYNKDYWYMEVSSAAASKYRAVSFLRSRYGFDRIVGFGDNLNDLPLFRACDETYAVENARDEVKSAASGIIPANTENGVALKISDLIKKPH